MPEINPSPFGEKQWFYHENDQALGPYSIRDLRELEEFGKISAATWIAEAGAAEWRPLSSVLSTESQVSLSHPPIHTVVVPPSPSPAKPDASDEKKGCIGCLTLIICGLLIAALVATCSNDDPHRLTEKELRHPKAAAEKLLKEEFGSTLMETGVTEMIGHEQGKIWIRCRFDNGSSGYISARSRMRNAMKHLYQSGLPLFQVTIVAHFRMVDKYGHESTEHAYEVMLTAEEAAKINWENTYDEQIDKIWEIRDLHPSLR